MPGTIHVKLRPLRLAFLVDPNDRSAVRTAIKTTTFLWGGMLNPLVPCYHRLPKQWADYPASVRPTAKSVVQGYLNTFDPDFVVKVGRLEQSKIDCGHYEILKCSDILTEAQKDGFPSCGIGLFEVLNHFRDKELRFVRHHPMQLRLPEFGVSHGLFLASLFGELSPEMEPIFRKSLQTLPGVTYAPAGIQNYWDFLAPENLFLRRLGMFEIRGRTGSGDPHDCLFFLNANRNIDVIDYWNLRALGWNIIPVCQQSATNDNLLNFASQIVGENSFAYRYNPKLYNDTLLLKSRSCSLSDFDRFCRALKSKLKPPRTEGETQVTCQLWYPRMWDEWAREKDGVNLCKVEVTEKKHQIDLAEKDAAFESMLPEFVAPFSRYNSPRVANEITPRLWQTGKLFAEVLPSGSKAVARAVGRFGLNEWRCSGSGLVYLPNSNGRTMRLNTAAADVVFTAWLKEKGWNAVMSDKGHIAHQMFKHLEGPLGLGFLTIPGMVEFIDVLAKKCVLSATALRSSLSSLAGKSSNSPFINIDNLTTTLVARKLIQLGIEVQCPECRQRSWYSVADADYQLKCTKCLEPFPLPTDRAGDIAWAYRAIGPCSLPRRAYGSITVLLTLRFFMQQLDGATTPMLSFTAKKGNREIEFDLGIFFRWSKYRQFSRQELVLAECKTFVSFEEKDAKRMQEIAREFPGAVLVFATLKLSLDKKEKRLLRRVANRGRKYWKDDRPSNPVLVLTGNELLANQHPRDVWREIGGRFADHSHHYGLQDLAALADATQQIYLDLPSWHESLRSRRRKQIPSAPLTPTASTNLPADDLRAPFLVMMQQVPFRPDQHI